MPSTPPSPVFDPPLAKLVTLPESGSWPAAKHRFDLDSVWAIRAALATGRPLLIRGEAGIGKSQLARASAHVMGIPFLSFVVHPRSEATDVLYDYDAVSRLAQAQVLSLDRGVENWRQQLAEVRFVRPGPLWWALDWKGARRQAARACGTSIGGPDSDGEEGGSRRCEPAFPKGWTQANGCVVLIDEIDKAEADFPNSLLESLGNHGFQIPLTGQIIRPPKGSPAPLVVITTNEDRELPVAFLRRCLVLKMTLGKTPQARLAFLLKRGRDHVSDDQVNDDLCRRVAEQLLKDRSDCKDHGPHRPGAAEFLDALRMLAALPTPEKQSEALDQVAGLAFRKNAEPETE